MKDSVFQIVDKSSNNQLKSKTNAKNLYQNLYQSFLSLSYGYYTQFFIKKIVITSQEKYQKLRKFQLRKILRQIIKKYLMYDLQIIYLAYFLNEHQWNFSNKLIIELLNGTETDQSVLQINKLKLFLSLLSFFVKTYVGSKQQVEILVQFHKQNMPLFLPIYKIWIQQSPKKLFQISPRQLNQIYSEYSRNCGNKSYKKDYNQMVDKILDLSTTYSIVPTKQKMKNQIVKNSYEQQKKQQIKYQKRFTRNSQLSLLDHNTFKIMDFSEMRSNKKQSIILSGLNYLNSNIQTQHLDKKQIQKLSQPRKIISLNKKKKQGVSEPNNVTKSFFCNKQHSIFVQQPKKSESYLRDPINFLDIDSRIQNLPFNYRNSSNIFGPSNLF